METSWFLDSPTAGDTPASFQLVRRGYDPVEVQAFARTVASDIERLQEDNLSLRRALDDAEARPRRRSTRRRSPSSSGRSRRASSSPLATPRPIW